MNNFYFLAEKGVKRLIGELFPQLLVPGLQFEAAIRETALLLNTESLILKFDAPGFLEKLDLQSRPGFILK